MPNKNKINALAIILVSFLMVACAIKTPKAPWVADLGNGTYKNPVLFADYSDPDVVRVGDDFYMVSSSFNSAPGLPVLHSKDLVNWRLVNHIIQQQVPLDVFAKPQHGNGVWAPCIRYHDGKYWVFFPDPDYGIYMTHTVDPEGEWSKPVLMLPGKGIIDPSPLWDGEGSAYLIHAWAKSRAGFNNVLTLHRMAADGSRVLDEGKVVIDGNQLPDYTTLEGPKFYKHDGYYYVFAPAGGVEAGWQSVFRAKNIGGPYEVRIVLAQGNTGINGPHQGAWVTTQTGESWFLHFQSREAYGRLVHLQPMQWTDGWPVMGNDNDGDGVGEPVAVHQKPNVGKPHAVVVPATSDNFTSSRLGLQWQWNANWHEDWYSLSARKGLLRLYAQFHPEAENLWLAPFLLLQKLPAPEFHATVNLMFENISAGDYGGLLVYGYDYAWIGVRNLDGKNQLVYVSCIDARQGCEEQVTVIKPLTTQSITLRLSMTEGGLTGFAYSEHGSEFSFLPETLLAKPGRWVGAKVGLFMASHRQNSDGFIDVDRFIVD